MRRAERCVKLTGRGHVELPADGQPDVAVTAVEAHARELFLGKAGTGYHARMSRGQVSDRGRAYRGYRVSELIALRSGLQELPAPVVPLGEACGAGEHR